MTKKTPAEAEAMFSEFLGAHNNGASERLASEALRRLVAAVEETGKKGFVTLKVSIEPMKNTDGMVTVTVDVAEKLPVLPPKASVFFTDSDGNLSRQNPAQGSLFDGDVKDSPAGPAAEEAREVAADTSNVRELGGRAAGDAR